MASFSRISESRAESRVKPLLLSALKPQGSLCRPSLPDQSTQQSWNLLPSLGLSALNEGCLSKTVTCDLRWLPFSKNRAECATGETVILCQKHLPQTTITSWSHIWGTKSGGLSLSSQIPTWTPPQSQVPENLHRENKATEIKLKMMYLFLRTHSLFLFDSLKL